MAGRTKQINSNENISDQLKMSGQNVFNQSSVITEKVNLLTGGILSNVPKEVTLKALQRKDKKKVLMSNNTDNIFLDMLQACIIDPADFNVYSLIPIEVEYLLYRLRVLTYGDEIEFQYNCEHCGHLHKINCSLNDLDIIPLRSDFKLQFDIPELPKSKTIISCKLLTQGEFSAVNKKADELQELSGDQNAYINTLWETRIISINGDTNLSPIQKQQFVDNLVDLDFEYMQQYYDFYEGNYGLQHNIKKTCENCKNIMNVNVPTIYTFFRPTFKFNRI